MLHVSEEQYSSMLSFTFMIVDFPYMHQSVYLIDSLSSAMEEKVHPEFLQLGQFPSLTYQTGEYVMIMRSAHIHCVSLTNERRNTGRGEIDYHLNQFTHRVKPGKQRTCGTPNLIETCLRAGLKSSFPLSGSFTRYA